MIGAINSGWRDLRSTPSCGANTINAKKVISITQGIMAVKMAAVPWARVL